jgi:hypothetical protein
MDSIKNSSGFTGYWIDDRGDRLSQRTGQTKVARAQGQAVGRLVGHSNEINQNAATGA